MEVFLIFPKSKQAQQELGQELAKFQSEQALKSIQKLPCSTVLAPGAHSQFGSGKNTQFEPEQRANPFENVFSKTAVFPPPAIAETDL